MCQDRQLGHKVELGGDLKLLVLAVGLELKKKSENNCISIWTFHSFVEQVKSRTSNFKSPASQLYALATNPDTFLTEPHTDEADEFKAWKSELDKRRGEISESFI